MYPNIRELNVTAGAQGSYSLYGNAAPVFVSACNLSGVIETTGAGDTFCASLLDYLLTHGLEPDPGKPPGNAPLRQHRRLHRHHPQGCHPGHAPGGRGPGAAVTTAQYAKNSRRVHSLRLFCSFLFSVLSHQKHHTRDHRNKNSRRPVCAANDLTVEASILYPSPEVLDSFIDRAGTAVKRVLFIGAKCYLPGLFAKNEKIFSLI